MPLKTPEKRRGPRLTAEMLTQAELSLTELDWRLLHWLLRYPLQRADDLVVGVARWASRATVYRHLQGLEANGLVESVLPKTPGVGKRLSHLSNLGLHVLSMRLERPADELAQQWQASEAGVLRRLARLPTLLLLQEVVNGLVIGTAEAMTNQGRRPELIRWTWQRDVVHHFYYREQAMRMFVDGAVALCIRAPQSDGTPLDQWYGLFLLFTELADEPLMRLRLERLLCWRESPERWPSYQHMLPVLILATSPRQAEHWQHAVETSALKLRLDPLRGVLTCLTQAPGAHVNPWRLAWRTLSTNHPCHLADLLRPVSPVVFPPFLCVDEGEEERQHAGAPPSASGASGPVERLTRLVVGNLACRAATIPIGDLEEREVIALLGLRLTPCHWSIVLLLLAHPLLSDEELAGLLGLERKSVRSSLYTLHTLGCLEPISTLVGKRWHLCERGLRLLAAANHLHLRNFAVASKAEAEEEASHMQQRGEAWLLSHIHHTAGVYGFFTSLAQAAKQQPGQDLYWWETSALCERRYRRGEQWYNLRPDALGAYRVGSKQIHFWLEWDRGTMNARDLATKFLSYAHYIDSREWAREWATLPLLVCIAPDVAQERRIQRVAQAALSHIPGLVVCTTTAGMLKEHGPLAPIWTTGILPSSHMVSQSSPSRKLVFHMHSEKEVT
jgi:DNA-binding IclR family transcriptional regulator